MLKTEHIKTRVTKDGRSSIKVNDTTISSVLRALIKKLQEEENESK